MKFTTSNGRIIEFKKSQETWGSHKQNRNDDGSYSSEKPSFEFADILYREYSQPMDFEKDLQQFLDFYLDNEEKILSQTQRAFDGIVHHNHDLHPADQSGYLIAFVEIMDLKPYQFIICFVFMHGFVTYDISYEFLSPEHFIITKIERILSN
ncbi:hypothetical protein CLU96_4227 [Chryseobacterium sp. 52]|uniref:hypothetical protein n=1 Tax=Chryseobacterium sp. 52 TaxID=2035213 RepID=UPI000C17FE12|nr:hypothetical protein [Chryseobacterium sp. 52]PIF47178.1 hypothetical protein CLU96_4227 [Chryseobacterium sp. 52]